MDPFGVSVPYPRESLVADVVTMSHEHDDHNDMSDVKGSPVVLRGVDSEGGKFRALSAVVGDVTFRSVESFHDDKEGSERGPNAIFVVETGGLRVVHGGDLGHMLDGEALESLKPCDILLMPVGGHYTVDARTAADITKRIGPRVVVPMHYKTKHIESWPITGVDEFLGRLQWKTKNVGRDVVLARNALTEENEIWVFATP